MYTSVQVLLVSVHLHLGSKPVTTLLVPADKGVVSPVNLLFLLPLHGMLLSPVFLQLPWVDATPPDVELVFTKLTLPAPFLSVNSSFMNLHSSLLSASPGTAFPPGAGVADEEVDGIDVLLPVGSRAKALLAMLALESLYFLVNSFNVIGENMLGTEL